MVVLTILLSLDALPLLLQQQAITLLSRAATFEEVTIAPGASRVALGIAADGTITNRLTTEPLQARASVAPVPLTTLQGDPFCDGKFCYRAFPASANRESLWAVSVPVALRWRFTSTAETVFSEVSYPVLEDWEAYLTYDSASGWQVPVALNAGSGTARQLFSLSCATGAALLQAQMTGQDWTISVAHEAGMQGCRLISQQAREDQDAFVWRFGVLLAADARAQSVLPALPLAQPADSAAVGG